MKIYKIISKRSVAGLSVVCLLSLFLSSCLKDNHQYYTPPPSALVSFTQASPDQPPLNLFFNNNKVNYYNPIGYGDYIDYIHAYVGQRTINLYNFATGGKIISDTVTFKQDSIYSLFLANTTTNPQILLVKDSISMPAAGNATIRFINLSPDAPAVDLAITGGAVLIANKSFKGYSSFVPTPGNQAYSFEVRQHGSNTVLATLPNITINNGFVYTLWFHGLVTTANQSDKLTLGIVNNAYYY